MANNDYFTIAYKVLSYLKYCYENDLDPDADNLARNGVQYFPKTANQKPDDAGRRWIH